MGRARLIDVIQPQVSGPARNVALEVLRRVSVVVIALWLILVILPSLVQAAG